MTAARNALTPAVVESRAANIIFGSRIDTASRHELALMNAAYPVMPPLLFSGYLTRPLKKVPQLGWMVSDAKVAREILNSTDFSIVGDGATGHWWAQMVGDWVLEMFEGKGHNHFRTSTRDLFTAEHTSALVQRTSGQRLQQLTDRLAAGEIVDIAHEARVLTGRLAAELVGMDEDFVARSFDGATADDRYEAIFTMSERFANLGLGTLGTTALPAEVIAEGKRLTARLTANVETAYASAPDDTTIGRCRELGVPVEHTKGFALLMTAAGTDTVVSAMTRIVALLADTGQQQQLLHHRELIPDAVREGLRVANPVVMVGRAATKDVTIRGQQVKAGDTVKVLIWTITHSNGGFELERGYVPETRQLWFGGGRHLCLGAQLVHSLVGAWLEAISAPGKPWRIVSRDYEREVLVPTYHRLELQLQD